MVTPPRGTPLPQQGGGALKSIAGSGNSRIALMLQALGLGSGGAHL